MKNLLRIALFLIISNSYLLAQGGLKADYYDGTNFERYVATEFVNNIDFYWNEKAPVRGINPHERSVRYTGKLKSPKAGTYTFTARVDDGIRVWVGGVLVINNWQLNDVGFSEGKVNMKADYVYDIKIEYFNALNEAELRLLWKIPETEERGWLDKWWNGDGPVVVPAQYFSPPKEEKVEVKPEPKPAPIVKPTPKPKPTLPVEEPVVVAPPKPAVKTFQKYIPKSVEFNRAESEILPISFPELDKLAAFLEKNPHHKVTIEGHTDNVGDVNGNFVLSERRAKAVAAYLIKKGVNHKQIKSAKGFGGSKPLVQSDGKKYHPENRRVEFVVE